MQASKPYFSTLMQQKNQLVHIPIYHSSLLLIREFLIRHYDELEKGTNLYNLVSDSEKFVIDTLDIIQNIEATLETIEMAYGFICKQYDSLENIAMEFYKFDVYHSDMFYYKIATLHDLIYKLTSKVYNLTDWIRAINKKDNHTGAKFNFSFIKKHKEEVKNKINNLCLFYLLYEDMHTYLQPVVASRNRSSHDGKMNDNTYHGAIVAFLSGVEKGIMHIEDLKELKFAAGIMLDDHEKLKEHLKIHLDNAYDLTRMAFCSLSSKYLKVLGETLGDEYKEILSRVSISN